MIYVYDMVMNNRRVNSFKRYGVRYKLERKFLMGNREFYSFIAPGRARIARVGRKSAENGGAPSSLYI